MYFSSHAKFHCQDEFLAEIKADREKIEPVLRATLLWKKTSSLPVVSLSLVATVRTVDSITRLDESIGEIMKGDKEGEEKVLREADQKMVTLEKKAAELGLEFRAGIWEPVSAEG